MTFVFLPYLAESMHSIECVPLMRKEFDEYLRVVEDSNPDIKFDLTYMNKFKNKDLWFIEML